MWMWSVCPAACQIVRNPAAWTSATIPSISDFSDPGPESALTSSAPELRHL